MFTFILPFFIGLIVTAFWGMHCNNKAFDFLMHGLKRLRMEINSIDHIEFLVSAIEALDQLSYERVLLAFMLFKDPLDEIPEPLRQFYIKPDVIVT